MSTFHRKCKVRNNMVERKQMCLNYTRNASIFFPLILPREVKGNIRYWFDGGYCQDAQKIFQDNPSHPTLNGVSCRTI